MNFGDFFDIAVYANVNWNHGNFTDKEVACGAHEYYEDFNESCIHGRPLGSIISLLKNLEEDITDETTWKWSKQILEEIEEEKNGR